MIHEHVETELASAAIDFGLTPELERELALVFRDCPVCAERAAAYREQIRLMQRLPVLDASEATRRRVMDAALGRRADRPSGMLLLVAAALLIGLTLAISAAAGAFRNRSAPPGLSLADPSPSSLPSPATSNGAETEGPVPSDAGLAQPFARGTIVEVVSGNLRVRSQPRVATDSIKYEPLLHTGDQLVVVDGPVTASAYDWYQVEPIKATGSRTADALPRGWVARADHDGTPWLDAAPLQCPATPVRIAGLVAMGAYERLACLGSRDLSFSAIVRGGTEPGWYAHAASGPAAGSADDGLALGFDRNGSVAPGDLVDGDIVVLEGGFDRSDRFDCPVVGASDAAMVELRCRAYFVVTKASAS